MHQHFYYNYFLLEVNYCIITGTTIGSGTAGHSGASPQGFSGVITSSAGHATAVLVAIVVCAVTG